MKVRKKPVDAEAISISDILYNTEDISFDWFTDAIKRGYIIINPDHIEIFGFDGYDIGHKQDWLVRFESTALFIYTDSELRSSFDIVS